MVASLALVVAFMQGEYLAGVVIVMMLTTGQALEAYGQRHTSDALAALLERAPKIAHRLAPTAGDVADVVDVDVAEVRTGDLLLVRPGIALPLPEPGCVWESAGNHAGNGAGTHQGEAP